MVRVLSDAAVADLLDLEALLPVIEDAFRAQGRGAVQRPQRPHFPVGAGLDGREEPAGTGLTMSAYVHGADHYATKIVGVHEGNPARGLETVNALVVMTDSATGLPQAIMAGNRITKARTGVHRRARGPRTRLGAGEAGAHRGRNAGSVAGLGDHGRDRRE